MFRWTQPAGRLVTLALLAACATDPGVQVESEGPGDHPETAVAIIMAAADGVIGAREGVVPALDPGLMDVPRTGRFPSEADYRAVPPTLRARYVAAIRERGLDTLRALPLREGCSGLLVPPPDKETHGCPAENLVVLVFDLPENGDSAETWTVPVFELGYNTRGHAARIMEVLVAESPDGPRYTDARNLFFFD